VTPADALAAGGAAIRKREALAMRRILGTALVAGLIATGGGLSAGPASAQDKPTIALIPGLTTDAFYITMRKGAQHAADALGVELIFQGGPDFNPTVQVPVLNAVTARQPDAILIAPTDKQQLIAPLRQAHDAGIKIITVDTFIDDGQYQDGDGSGDFPLSYVASDNVLGGFMAGAALGKALDGKGKVYVSNVKPGISTTDQREEGFKLAMSELFPGIEVLETQFNDDDANKAASQLQAVFARNPDLAGVFGANLFSAIGAADGVKAVGKTGQIRVVAFDAPQRIVDDIKSGLIDMAIAQHPAEIGYYGVMTAYAALTGQSVPIDIGTGFTVMDASNIDDPEILKFVYSD
jgi:ribose transport system substrate-binding protein